MEKNKICRTCEQEKHINDFYIKGNGYRDVHCIPCKREHTRNYARANEEKEKEICELYNTFNQLLRGDYDNHEV